MSFELIRVFLGGEHWVGLLGGLRLITDFHCHDCWSPSWERLTDGEWRWRRLVVCNLVDLADGDVVGVEVSVHTPVDGQRC